MAVFKYSCYSTLLKNSMAKLGVLKLFTIKIGVLCNQK